ncbi:MAG: hypothetical protein BGN92_07130 [Sphingobacteriales bacterium 41-5]|nr:MAG: hypothetical protein BGN92_07130 [Sphingobacteriales bacterium 41-5]
MNWKQAINEARARYMTEHYQACKDFGVPAKRYSDRTANALTACILDFLKYSGCYANRINTTGMPRNINGRTVWTKSTTNKGTADIDSIINGKPVKIEIKIGADKMSEAQHRERARIEAAGGIYLVVKDMQSFYDWFVNYAAKCGYFD